ncbi:hypothetical protein QQF64_018677 [Cirrhinus molitorella]|uniref:Uncharacterized protein n=2 Tax=Cirrhinus molitorella TaxID=172907 RepID=A0AA88PZV3_9TELE|nr:hypothetical protein Q8A67_006227 [Cirrhinus molitorella]
MIISHLVACGLILTLLSVSSETKPLTQAEQRSLRMLLGEELSELLASDESQRRMMENRVRLLRDLRLDTRAKGPRLIIRLQIISHERFMDVIDLGQNGLSCSSSEEKPKESD